MIYEENTKEIMRVKESVYPNTEFCLFSNLNFDFLPLYKMYSQNCFANRCIKLVSFTNHLQHLRYMLIQHGRSRHVVNST